MIAARDEAGNAFSDDELMGRVFTVLLAGERVRQALLPIGAGPRTCPGRYLAMLKLKMCWR